MPNIKITNQHYWAALLFIVLVAVTIIIPRDVDYWWHLRNGQWMAENNEILRIDPFSFTMLGEPRIAYDWLADIGLYHLWQLWGDVGVAVLVSIISVIIFASIFYMLPGHIYIRFIVIMPLLFFLVKPALAPRPQILSLLFFTWVVLLTYRYKRGMDKKWLALMPLLFVVWANLHGGWSVAAIFMVLVTIGEVLNNLLKSKSKHIMTWERLKWYFGACALSAGALLLTPFGLDLVLFPITALFSLSSWNSQIIEWFPTPLGNLRGVTLIIFTLIYIGIIIYQIRQKRIDWTSILVGIVMGYMAYRYRRSVVFFGLIGAPLMIEQFSTWLNLTAWGRRNGKSRPIAITPVGRAIKHSMFILVTLFVAGYVNWRLSPVQIAEDINVEIPVEAIQTMQEQNLPQPLFNHYDWGGYLLWHAPEYPVFIDGRTDLYRDFYFEWRNMLDGKDWEEGLEKWDIQTVLVYAHNDIGILLEAHPDWETVFKDDRAILLTRSTDD